MSTNKSEKIPELAKEMKMKSIFRWTPEWFITTNNN